MEWHNFFHTCKAKKKKKCSTCLYQMQLRDLRGLLWRKLGHWKIWYKHPSLYIKNSMMFTFLLQFLCFQHKYILTLLATFWHVFFHLYCKCYFHSFTWLSSFNYSRFLGPLYCLLLIPWQSHITSGVMTLLECFAIYFHVIVLLWTKNCPTTERKNTSTITAKRASSL